MILKFKNVFTNLYEKIFYSIKRFPITLIIALITAITLIYYNHINSFTPNETRELVKRFAMTFSLGIPVSLCIKMIFERKPQLSIIGKTIFYIIGCIILAYFYYLSGKEETIYIINYIAFTIIFYAVFTVIPYFHTRNNYDLYVIKLFTNFFITYLYSLILYGGLSSIIFAIDKLFNMNINGDIYVDILILVGCIFALVYFLSSVPKYEDEINVSSYSKILSILIVYILTPIIAVYLIVMYSFFIKIIITGEWPRNLICHLVLWYSLISSWIIFFLHPLKRENKFAENFVSWFPRFIIPIIIMMFIAIGIRIYDYGITELRYLVIIGGIWVFINMFYLSFVKNENILVMTLLIIIFSTISIIGPFSVYGLSIHSQNIRFKNILERNDMLSNGNIIKTSNKINEKDIRDLTSIMNYFNNNHRLADLNYLPENFNVDKIEEVFGFKPDYNLPNIEPNILNYTLDYNNQVFSIDNYSYFIDYGNYMVNYKLDNSSNILQGNLNIIYNREDLELKINENNKQIYQLDINNIANKMYMKNGKKDILPQENMTFVDENDKVKIKLIFKNIYGTLNNNKLKVIETNFYVFIKLK